MKAIDLINLIPEERFSFLAAGTKVDYKVQKLHGKTMFQLILYSLLTTRKASLRVMESVFHSYGFRQFSKVRKEHTRFTSIRDRLNTIKADYFEQLFSSCYELFSSHVENSDKHILRYDSTMVALSAKLLDIGMKVGSKTEKKQIKFSVGFDGLLPASAKVFTGQKHLSEDLTLPGLIQQASQHKDEIAVFDRGVTARKTFANFEESQIRFVTRLRPDARYDVVQESAFSLNPESSVTIHSDQMVHLYSKSKVIKHPFRLIRASIKATDEPIVFLTNIKELSAEDIALIYKKRWDIEVFFKFIKQELNFSHIMVKGENALKVMLYMTLITAQLIITYKKINKLQGYKIPKLMFALELEEELIRQIVIICGGDPAKMHPS